MNTQAPITELDDLEHLPVMADLIITFDKCNYKTNYTELTFCLLPKNICKTAIQVKINIIIGILVALLSAHVSLAQDYVITDYGARAVASHINTKAINEAITKCYENGGGRVVVPAGTFISGTLIMKNNVELHLSKGATLLASTDIKEIPFQPDPGYISQKSPGGWRALIYANEVSNISIAGSGTIDGNGKKQEAHPRTPELNRGDLDGRPRNILFISCKKILIEGIKMQNSGIWNQHYLHCENLRVNNIEVYNHSRRNNDGIDIDGCKDVVISNSIFDTDDDAIVLKNTGPDVTENVIITNCIVSRHTNGIKLGTESTAGFRNIVISDCIIKPSQDKNEPIFGYKNGISGISLEITDGGIMEGISVDNVVIEKTASPLFISLSNRARKYKEGIPMPKVGQMRNISISNVTAYGCGNYTASITGIPGHPIEDITLSNVKFYNEGGVDPKEYLSDLTAVEEYEKRYPEANHWKYLPASGLFLRHVKNLIINGILIDTEEEDLRIPIMAEDVEGLLIKNIGQIKHNKADVFFYGKDIREFSVESPLGWKKKKQLVVN